MPQTLATTSVARGIDQTKTLRPAWRDSDALLYAPPPVLYNIPVRGGE